MCQVFIKEEQWKNTKSYLLAVNNVAKFEGKNDAKGANDTDNKSRSNVVDD